MRSKIEFTEITFIYILLDISEKLFRNRVSAARLCAKTSAHLPLEEAEASISKTSGFLISDFFWSGVIAFSTMLPRSRSTKRFVGTKCLQGKRLRPENRRLSCSVCSTRCDGHSDTVTNTAELATLRGEHLAHVGQLNRAVEAPPALLLLRFSWIVPACLSASHKWKRKTIRRLRTIVRVYVKGRIVSNNRVNDTMSRKCDPMRNTSRIDKCTVCRANMYRTSRDYILYSCLSMRDQATSLARTSYLIKTWKRIKTPFIIQIKILRPFS